MKQSRHQLQKLAFEAAAETHPGRVRNHNEDHYLVSPRLALYAVCDGMGGHLAGELASEIAIETIPRAMVATQSAGQQTPNVLLTEALYAAHKAILDAARDDASRLGMGTTAVLIWVPPPGDVVWVAHVGDSRAYWWHAGQLQQLTEDHTWYNQILRAGILPANSEDWPNRHVLSQALGASTMIAPEVGQVALQAGDFLLLCSDGLTDMLDDTEIAKQFSGTGTPETISQALVDEANRLGGKDNITVIVIRATSSSKTAVPTSPLPSESEGA